MKMKKTYTKEKEELLSDFFNALQEGSMAKIGQVIGAGCSIFVLVISFWLPYQLMDDSKVYLVADLYFGACGVICYMLPYLSFKEGNKLCRIDDKLKYLPISQRELRSFRFRKLVRFWGKVFLLFLVGQLFFAIVLCHGLVWGNLLYPLVLGLLAPLVFGKLVIR